MAKTSLVCLLLAGVVCVNDTDDLVASAKEICKKEGVKLDVQSGKNPWWQMVYEHTTDTIHLNLDDKYFKDPRHEQHFLFKAGFYSTDHKDHIIRHEIAHRRYYKTCGEAAYIQLLHQPCPLPKDRVKQTVGAYACENACEFVAECQTALYYGRKLPEDIQEAYRKLWIVP